MSEGRARGRRRYWTAATALAIALSAGVLGPAGPAPAAPAQETFIQPDETPLPACFGALSRHPTRPCRNPALANKVIPTPFDAVLETSSRCELEQRIGPVSVCGFGRNRLEAGWNVALLGDSHAAHWRGALKEISDQMAWRARSIARPGCAFTMATPKLDEAERRTCVQWNTGVRRWFRDHAEVNTVFVSANAGTKVVTRKGQRQNERKIRGYIDAWNRLPKSVEHIVVLRDTPLGSSATFDCVEGAIARKRITLETCARPRKRSLRTDPMVLAARRVQGRGRVKVLDLTQYMCGRSKCYAVIGGALVHRDSNHLTDAFSRSLGPFVQRRLQAYLTRWRNPLRPYCAVLPAVALPASPRAREMAAGAAAIVQSAGPDRSRDLQIDMIRGNVVIASGSLAGTVPATSTPVRLKVRAGVAITPGLYTMRTTGTRTSCPEPTTRIRSFRLR